MPQLSQFKIRWTPRDCPLTPMAVAGQGEISLRLARRLLQLDDESLGQLEGVAGRQVIVVQGRSDLLPWVDGVQYLGIDSVASSVLFPTTYQPSLPQALLARALRVKLNAAGLIAVLRDPLLLVPMRNARPVSRQTLVQWLEQQ
jgi:MoxR-vWA-beta-propeller ternary system protein